MTNRIWMDSMSDLLLEWDWKKNEKNDVGPYKLGPYSHIVASWICKNNSLHKWTAMLKTRTLGHGCPYCSGRRDLKKDSLGE